MGKEKVTSSFVSGVTISKKGEVEYEHGCNGSISEVTTDMEAMGGGRFGSKQNSCFLSQLFSCSLQVSYIVMKPIAVHDETR